MTLTMDNLTKLGLIKQLKNNITYLCFNGIILNRCDFNQYPEKLFKNDEERKVYTILHYFVFDHCDTKNKNFINYVIKNVIPFLENFDTSILDSKIEYITEAGIEVQKYSEKYVTNISEIRLIKLRLLMIEKFYTDLYNNHASLLKKLAWTESRIITDFVEQDKMKYDVNYELKSKLADVIANECYHIDLSKNKLKDLIKEVPSRMFFYIMIRLSQYNVEDLKSISLNNELKIRLLHYLCHLKKYQNPTISPDNLMYLMGKWDNLIRVYKYDFDKIINILVKNDDSMKSSYDDIKLSLNSDLD